MDAMLIAFFRFALDVALKATFVFAAAGLTLLFLRRRPAAERHLIGSLALGAAILFPVLAPFLPRLAVPLLPSPVARTGIVSTTAPRVAAESLAATAGGAKTGEIAPAEAASDDTALEPLEAAEDVPGSLLEQPLPISGADLASSGAGSPRRFEIPLAAMAVALGVWLLVAAALLARLAVGIARARRLRRRAEPIVDAEWRELAESVREALPTGRRVGLYWSDRVPVAVTAGLRQPVLLLPTSARSWDEPRRRVVLLHEMAHVARRDWPALLLAEAALALYWFHPLAWVLHRRLRRDAERAADDRVLAAGTKPSVYAGHLLGIFRSLRPGSGQPLPVMGMARPSHFEERLRSILDPKLGRRGISARQKAAAGAFFVIGAASLAILQPWSSRDAEAALPEIESVAAAAPEAPAPVPAARAAVSPAKPVSSCPKSRHAAPAASAPERALAVEPLSALAPIAEDSLAPEEGETPAPEAAASPSEGVEEEAPTPAPPAGFVPAGKSSAHDGKDWYRRAWHLHQDEQWAAASEAFTRAYAAGYQKGMAAYNAACGFARDGQPDAALSWLAKSYAEGFDVVSHMWGDDDLASLRKDPRFSELRRRLRQADAAAKRGEAEELGERFRTVAEQYPRRAGELYALGTELLQAGSYDLAAQSFRLSARAGIRPGESLYNAACAYALKGERDRALDLLQRSLEAGFDDPVTLRRDDDLDSIRQEPRFHELAALADGLELDVREAGSGKKPRGSERERWGREAAAFAAFAASHPEIGRAWFNLGFASLAAGDASTAASAFEKSLALRYRESATLYNLACANARLGRRDEAFGYLFRAVERGFSDRGLLRRDEDLAALRSDARFLQALELAPSDKGKKEF